MASMSNAVLEDSRILFRNFRGEATKFEKAGVRTFCVALDSEVAEVMKVDGWNVKQLKARDEEEAPLDYLQVAVNFDGPRPPRVVMITSRGKSTLGEDMVDMLDYAEIRKVDLILRPYEWEVNGNTGVKAYLQSIYVTIEEDELEKKYGELDEVSSPSSSRPSEARTPSFDDDERPF